MTYREAALERRSMFCFMPNSMAENYLTIINVLFQKYEFWNGTAQVRGGGCYRKKWHPKGCHKEGKS
jgi:hypothetical protein